MWLCVMSRCRMTRPVICRYVSVSYRLLSVVSCRQGLPQVVETSVTNYRQQTFSGLHSPGRSNFIITCYLRVQPICCAEFLLTISTKYKADNSDENKVKYQLGDHDYKLIQYQILQTNITRVVWQTVTRITNEILGVKGLRCCTTVKVLYQSDR